MSVIKAIVRDRQVVPLEPVEWPDRTELTVAPRAESETIGIRDEDWPTDPEEIRQLLDRMERIEPLEMSAEEEADIAEWRARVKTYTISNMNKGIDELFE